jgi:hypothetical protein
MISYATADRNEENFEPENEGENLGGMADSFIELSVQNSLSPQIQSYFQKVRKHFPETLLFEILEVSGLV